MDLTPEDQKVVDLLSKLKDSNGTYPSETLSVRREAYLKQVANVGLGIGVGAGLKNATKGGTGAGATGIVSSKILETLLVAAIVVEGGTAAFLYRDKIVNLIKPHTDSPKVQQVSPQSGHDVSAPIFEATDATVTPSPTVTSSDTPTVTVTVSVTPAPNLAGNNNGTNLNANSTPNPGGNNGNHYGLTPKPVRTKDNTNSGDANNNTGASRSGKNNKP